MEKRVQSGWLLDFYGPLLTARQQALLRLYCEADLSLAEIAAQESVSRQAVHDAVKKGMEQLDVFERQLGLLARYRRLHDALSEAVAVLDAVTPDAAHQQAFSGVRAKLHALLSAEEDSDGI